MAHDRGFRCIELHVDSRVVVNSLKNNMKGVLEDGDFCNILLDCLRWIGRLEIVTHNGRQTSLLIPWQIWDAMEDGGGSLIIYGMLDICC